MRFLRFGINNGTVYENGQLLKLALENGFEVFITTDKNLQYQQNIKKWILR